jgi:hypothetical protein
VKVTRRPDGSKADRGPYRARFTAEEGGYLGSLGVLYRNEYNDGLFEVDADLKANENWTFEPDDVELPGLMCGLSDVELLDD